MKKAFMILAVWAMVFATGCHKDPENGGNNGGGNGGNSNPTTGTVNGHEWIDLGLPSGILWATCNVGANSPEEYGDYFAWGETTAKETYEWSTYKYNDGNNLTKYTGSDNREVLEASDDAAHVNWGGAWRMPTADELRELRDNCIHKCTTQNGVNGHLFTALNGNSLFLPAAGNIYDGEFHYPGGIGSYWSSSLSTDNHNTYRPYNAMYFSFNLVDFQVPYCSRYLGLTVRPVCSVFQK